MQATASCSVSSGSNAREKIFMRLMESSKWLQLLYAVMQIAGAVTELMNIQRSNTQLCHDLYYRNLKGIHTLVEKEWVLRGHRLNHRSNLDNERQASIFPTIFLQKSRGLSST